MYSRESQKSMIAVNRNSDTSQRPRKFPGLAGGSNLVKDLLFD